MATVKPVVSDRCWQFDDGEGHAISFVDKLIGVEILAYLWNRDVPQPVSIVIPPEHVGSLAQALMRFGIEGDVAISRRGGGDADK